MKRFLIPVIVMLSVTMGQGAARPAAGKPSLTKVWVGEDLWQFGGERDKGNSSKGWRMIAGSKLNLPYSGKGPLPKPVELVIPLGKPLPLGTVYYLSVKNWYRGKMEATLGDITQPLEIKRYDWTPIAHFEPNELVDKITLRYYPTLLVQDMGKVQAQPYIVQGVFISTEPTKVPFEDGKLISLMPEETPAVHKGNYFDNGSFETGLYPWGPATDVARNKLISPANLDVATAIDGKCSLKVSADGAFGLNNKMYALSAGKYTFSFYAKADKPVQLAAKIRGLATSLKEYADTDLQDDCNLGPEWKRYSITKDLREMPGFLYTAEFRGETDVPTNIWIDAIQLENGDLTDYQQSHPVEIGYIGSKPGNIYYTGEEPAAVDVLLHGGGSQSTATVAYKVSDYWGKQVDQGSKVIELSGKDTRFAWPLFDKNKGIFRIVFSAGDSQAEMVYSVVPPNPHLTNKYPEGTLGTDGQLHDPKEIAILKRANFNWIAEKQMARWYMVEKEPGKYQFYDQWIQNANDANVMVSLQLFNMLPQYRNQPWLAPYVMPVTGGKATRVPGIWKEGKQEEFLNLWSKYVFATVDHYKDSVKDWEVFNEPNHEIGEDAAGGERYGHALKASAEAIHRADPQAKVIGFAGGGFIRPFYEAALKVAGPDAIDIFSVHFYGNEEKQFRQFADFLAAYHKPGRNSETGTSCNSFFTTLPGFALQQQDYSQHALDDLHVHTLHSVKNYLLTMSLGRMDKWFNYFARFYGASPSQPTKWSGNGFEITEYDGSLRANAVGLTIASHFIDGSKYVGPVTVDERLEVQLFQQGEGSVGFLWAGPGQAVTLAAVDGPTFYDVMGNPITAQTVHVEESPIYFTSKSNAQSCSQLLKGLKVTSGQSVSQ